MCFVGQLSITIRLSSVCDCIYVCVIDMNVAEKIILGVVINTHFDLGILVRKKGGFIF